MKQTGIEAFGLRQHKGEYRPILQRYEGPDACAACNGFGTHGNPLAGAVYTCKVCDGDGFMGPNAWIKQLDTSDESESDKQPEHYRDIPGKCPAIGPHTTLEKMRAWVKVSLVSVVEHMTSPRAVQGIAVVAIPIFIVALVYLIARNN